MRRNKTYLIRNNTVENYKIEIDLDFISGFTIKGLYSNKYDSPVLLVEEKYDDIDLLIDKVKLENILSDIQNKMEKNRERLIEIDSVISKIKKYDVE